MASTTSPQQPLATSRQLISFRQYDDSHAISQRFAQALLTQAAGVILRLPQQVVAFAIVLLQRYYIAVGGKSSYAPRSTSAACIYLGAKLSFTPLAPRSVINVYAYLLSPASPLRFVNPNSEPDPEPQAYYVTPAQHELHLRQLFAAESSILVSLGFSTHVDLPHVYALTYLLVLDIERTTSSRLARKVLAHLNMALLSPQLLYLTQQPHALAVAAIYIAAREEGIKLVQQNWWEVFDVDREDLGFLVLAMGSSRHFAEQEHAKWQEQGHGGWLDL